MIEMERLKSLDFFAVTKVGCKGMKIELGDKAIQRLVFSNSQGEKLLYIKAKLDKECLSIFGNDVVNVILEFDLPVNRFIIGVARHRANGEVIDFDYDMVTGIANITIKITD